MDIASNGLVMLKPLFEMASTVCIAMVSWFYLRINKNEKTIKDNHQDFNEFKLHVARTHPTSKELDAVKKDILREINVGFKHMEQLINAKTNK